MMSAAAAVAAMMAALLLLGCLSACRAAEATPDDGRSALDVSWALEEFRLAGTGAHRELLYSVSAALCSQGTGGAEAAGRGWGECSLKVWQPLQPGLFADPYQLAGLAKSRGLPVPEVLGELDLEGPEQSCSPTAVETAVPVWPEHSGSRVCGDALEGSAVQFHGALRLAVHSRYPQAQSTSPSRGQESAVPWMTGPSVVHIVQPPKVTLVCELADLTAAHAGIVFASTATLIAVCTVLVMVCSAMYSP